MSDTRGIDARVRPLSSWPAGFTRTPAWRRRDSPFKRTRRASQYEPYNRAEVPFKETVGLLCRELEELGAKAVVIEAGFGAADIRLDGWPRANARQPGDPGVVISFESRHGPLRYPCDTFSSWQANVRAVALALEALRKVDRYGVTAHGEQYRGFSALPPAGGSTPTMDVHAAAAFLGAVVGAPAGDFLTPPSGDDVRGNIDQAYRVAAKKLHPDVAGNGRDFNTLNEARAALLRFHGPA